MKKLSAILSAFILCFSMAVSAFALSGDIDSDGNVTAMDARRILRFSAGLEDFSESEKSVADINRDGKANAIDARLALRISAKLEKVPESETVRTEKGEKTEKLTANEVFSKASLFTAEIITYKENGTGLSVGTAFFIDNNKIVTAYHVINGAHSAKIKTHNGEILSVKKVLAYDTVRDISILETDCNSVHTAKVSSEVKTGDIVYALGSTKGYTGTFTQGTVSCEKRILSELDNGVEYIQFTAPVSEGNSGGPVLDEYGNVIGIVALTNEAGQNINFALPVTEIAKTDISSPLTLSAVAEKEAENTFEGKIALSTPAVTLRKGATSLLYALVTASDEYSLAVESDNDGITAQTGRSYGNVNVVYISAKENSVSGTVKIYIEGHKEVFALVDVTVGDDAPEIYGGIQGDVPDFGAFAKVNPVMCDENTQDGKNAYSFAYAVGAVEEENGDVKEFLADYKNLLAENGYVAVTSPQSNATAVYNQQNKTTVTFGVTADDKGEYFVFVLIIR